MPLKKSEVIVINSIIKKEQIAAVTHDKYARQKLLNDIPSF